MRLGSYKVDPDKCEGIRQTSIMLYMRQLGMGAKAVTTDGYEVRFLTSYNKHKLNTN